jgi:hypothetical protein
MNAKGESYGNYFQPAFVLCVATLALAGAGMSVATRQLGLVLKKEPLPLSKSLDALERAKLAPYQVVAELKIENEEVLESLGTEDYIQWVVEDPCEPADSGVSRVLVFITYYRLPDRVPHVPEECYTGGGYQGQGSEPVTFELDRGGRPRSVPGRYLLFRTLDAGVASGPSRLPVLYLFRVNGQYADSRQDARLLLNTNIFGRSSYFSKVELVYNQAFTAPEKNVAVDASERLLSKLLPILEQEHWPHWPPRAEEEGQRGDVAGPRSRAE